MEMTAYAAINPNESIRMQSSSGGVFTMLAECTLAQGGVVFGAAVTEGMAIRHIPVEDAKELYRLRGSKYVRSHLGESYGLAKEALEAGRQVLFSGTPCQIGGLRAYLKREYANLLCVDVICHGSPMASVWERYVQYRQQQAGAAATDVNFREKSAGWLNFHFCMTFENGAVYKKSLRDDPYMKAFLRDLSLGTSCYRCGFKGDAHQADITLGDFWGVAAVMPQMFDDRGTSLVFVKTEKGQEALDRLEGLQILPAPTQAAIKYNPAMVRSVDRPKTRDEFLEALETGDFEQVVRRFCPQPPLLQRMIRKAKQGVKKLIGRR